MARAGINRAGVRAVPAGDVAVDGAAGDVERVVAARLIYARSFGDLFAKADSVAGAKVASATARDAE
jgi:hypothetical protein